MYNKNKFRALDINHFLDSNEYSFKEDFSYAEIPGTANTFGYYIMFFYMKGNVEVLSIDSDIVDNSYTLAKANQILKFLEFDFQLGSPFVFKNPFNQNYIYEDNVFEYQDRYYYLIDEQLIVLGISPKGILVSLEMVNNKQIIDNRLK